MTKWSRWRSGWNRIRPPSWLRKRDKSRISFNRCLSTFRCWRQLKLTSSRPFIGHSWRLPFPSTSLRNLKKPKRTRPSSAIMTKKDCNLLIKYSWHVIKRPSWRGSKGPKRYWEFTLKSSTLTSIRRFLRRKKSRRKVKTRRWKRKNG